MAIKKIRISNFKSFKDLEIELGDFNILIGANASGKSNFIQIFKFLKDIIKHGLEAGISLQGGVEYLRNINIGANKNLLLEIAYDGGFEEYTASVSSKKAVDFIKIYEMLYKLAITFGDEGKNFKIAEDKLILKEKQGGKIIEELEEITSRVNGKVTAVVKTLSGKQREKFEYPYPPSSNYTILSNFVPPFITEIFSDISIYDFDPKLSKESTPITGKADLEEDGSNLVLVLKNIIEDKERKRKFDNLIKYLLPFVEDLEIEKFADKSLFFKLRENYFKDQYLPAFLLSDGTINMTALIIALYFEKKPLTIIEEPERNIHPYLISKLLRMMKEVSLKKQIIITTHNPEIVKYADLEDILLIARDKEGFSTISRPAEKEEIKIFLKNEIGIEELYAQKLLEM